MNVDLSKNKDGKNTSSLVSWLRIVRVPNLLTVPGESIAGLMLASRVPTLRMIDMITLGAASLCFYMAGLMINNVVDEFEDSTMRPERPIPCGAITKRQASTVAGILLILGGFLCYVLGGHVFWAGTVLICSIVSYNIGLKRVSVLGPVNMGLCRGFNFLLGAVAASGTIKIDPLCWVAAGVIVLYICSISQFATRETLPRFILVETWLPLFILTLGFVFLRRF
ncbi:MAG: hypothetical protein GKR87_02595 [Kiritimatiellae bacterium]|nr:hypothetical protein [Kiritimatiellia bacterium]